MKNYILFMLISLLICPSVEAMKVYSYDSNGNRVYRDVVSRYGADKNHKQVTTTRIYTSDYNPKLSSDRNGVTVYKYGPDGSRTGRIKRTGDGRVYVYGADGQRKRSYKVVNNRAIYNSRVNRTSYRVQPSGAFYR